MLHALDHGEGSCVCSWEPTTPGADLRGEDPLHTVRWEPLSPTSHPRERAARCPVMACPCRVKTPGSNQLNELPSGIESS